MGGCCPNNSDRDIELAYAESNADAQMAKSTIKVDQSVAKNGKLPRKTSIKAITRKERQGSVNSAGSGPKKRTLSIKIPADDPKLERNKDFITPVEMVIPIADVPSAVPQPSPH